MNSNEGKSTKKSLNLISKDYKGITLISLIITIIIMIILSSVTINIVINGGLFGTIKEAKKKTEIESYIEQLELIRVSVMMEQIENELTTAEFMTKIEEGVRESSTFNGSKVKKYLKSVKVTTKERYVFRITEEKVTYMKLESEQEELTLDLTEENAQFIYTPSDWTREQVQVNIEIELDLEELEAVLEYSLDGNTWTEYTSAVTLKNNGDKIYTRLNNKEKGKIGSTITGTVENIDRIEPKQFIPTGTGTDSSITLTGETTDEEASEVNGSSGIKAYYYSIDDGQTWLPQNGTTETSYTFNGLKDGKKYTTLRMKAVDNAGNEIITEAITVATKKINPEIGDYVNYTPQTDTTSYYIDSKYLVYGGTINQETLKWKILNINNDGTVDLISDTPTNSKLSLTDALGYNNGVYFLNDICKTLYSNSKYNAIARSINREDIEDKLDLSVWDYHDFGYIISGKEYKYGGIGIYTSEKSYPYMWTQEKTETNAIDEKVITGGTLNRSEQNELIEETYATASKSITGTVTYWQKAMNAENFKKVSISSIEDESNIYYNLFINNGSNYNGYWLATRSTGINYNNTTFHIDCVTGR